jgi:hypothetical protein
MPLRLKKREWPIKSEKSKERTGRADVRFATQVNRPRRVSQPELRSTFATGRTIESMRPIRFEARTDFAEITFTSGGPKAWLAVMKRTA